MSDTLKDYGFMTAERITRSVPEYTVDDVMRVIQQGRKLSEKKLEHVRAGVVSFFEVR